VVGYHRFRSQC